MFPVLGYLSGDETDAHHESPNNNHLVRRLTSHMLDRKYKKKKVTHLMLHDNVEG